ncbi:MFS-type transporter YusP [Diaporthe amygdali]|uniref:MFS-type transporter YusP n=1 Tax=Phomopsis amygdali TaxID=1214568 RepID=UPI0022FDFB0C|nr:MFS-type transporter YusP [Diaporthe amygdali]KAJ0124362.1 MFS-type transporter YusP [Diaporthe amygdali]
MAMEMPPNDRSAEHSDETAPERPARGWQFWGIIVSMQLISMLSALDTSAVSTAMPSILEDLGRSDGWMWIANAYFLTMTAFQPLFGQASNIYGRRSTTMLATFLFAVGSAVCGSARNLGALIAGRAIQGAGGGAISILIEINVADLVPLRERPQFMSIVLIAYTVAVCIGPVVGGALAQHASWRWIFYLNLPVCAVALAALFVFLRTRYRKDTVGNSLKRVDLGGNALLVASVVAVLIALMWGGTQFSWSSFRTVVPLVLGLVGIGAFIWLESTTIIPEPTMPLRLFSNRTSLGAFGISSLHAMLTNFLTYFLPIYFQGVRSTGPTQSGVNLLPLPFVTMPFAILGGWATTKWGRYRPSFFAGMGLLAICFGLLSRLNKNTSTAYWASVECIGAAGLGAMVTTTWPAVQAPLEEVDQAISTAAWGFVRSFGGVWGVAIPAATFNSRVNQLVTNISDPSIREQLLDGGAYALASIGGGTGSQGWTPQQQDQISSIYVESLKRCFQVGIGFSLLGFLISFIIKDVPLREHLDTEFGLEHPRSEIKQQPTSSSPHSEGKEPNEKVRASQKDKVVPVSDIV